MRRNRRRFLQQLGYTAGGLAVVAETGRRLHGEFALDAARARVAALPALKASRHASDRVELGKTGIQLSRVALGTGTHGSGHASDQTRAGMSNFRACMEHAFENGVNFWDSADQYGSHSYLRESLQRIPRKQVVILTKTHASTEAEMRADLDRFSQEIGTDYLDVVLLHCMTSADWPKEKSGAMQVLERAREQGRIRAHGVSCHDFGAMQTAARLPWVQVEFQRINPLGVPMDAEPEPVIALLRQMKASGQAIIGMKIFAEGRLSRQPDLALRHAIRLDCLDAFTVGMTSPAQFDDVAQRLPRLSVA